MKVPKELNRRHDDRWFDWFTKTWNFIDDRDIDKHVVSLSVMLGTWKITSWAMTFASLSPRPGLEVAAIIGAVMVPYSALQTLAISSYFKSRTTE